MRAIITFFFLPGICLSGASDFNPARRLAPDLGPVTEAALAIDGTDNPGIAVTSNNEIFYLRGFNGFASGLPVSKGLKEAVKKDRSAIATDGTGGTYIAFRVHNGTERHQIAWTHNRGGSFQPASIIPKSAGRGLSGPEIKVSPEGSVLIGWWKRGEAGGEGPQIFLSINGREPAGILSGREVSFAIDGFGTVHAAYVKEGDIFYSNNSRYSFSSHQVRITNSQAVEYAPQIAAGDSGLPSITYMSEQGGGENIYVTAMGRNSSRILSESGFSGGVSIQQLRPSNGFFCTFPVGDTLIAESWLPTFVYSRRKVCDLRGTETAVATAVDKHSYVHVAMIRSEKLFYFNDAAPPKADMAAAPVRGIVPLTVQFQSKCEGHVLRYRWEFGDGEQSLLPDPVHTYGREGTYSVSLRVVSTAGVSSEIVKEDLIVVEPKKCHLTVSDMTVYEGDRFRLPVKVTTPYAFKSFQVVGRFDPEVISFWFERDFVDFQFTASEPVDPEFVGARQEREDGVFAVGVVYDVARPITGKQVQPGSNMNIANLLVEVKPGSAEKKQTVIELGNRLGSPSVSNILTIDVNETIYPALHHGTITILDPGTQWAGPRFVRGDTNNNGYVEVGDAIFTLEFLFGSGPRPFCTDTADIDDDGMLNIGDVISLLSFLFSPASTYPCSPFPSAALDPTEDSLPACGESR